MDSQRIGRETPGYRALRNGRWSGTGHAYHLRTRVRDRVGPPLTGPAAARVAACLLSWQDTGRALLLAFAVMPDHLHVLAVLAASGTLQERFGQWKTWCAKEVNKGLERRGPVWQAGFFDHRIRRSEDVSAIGRYIEHNPVRRGLASRAETYRHSSAHPEFAERMLGRPWLAGASPG
jgi:putative transposase